MSGEGKWAIITGASSGIGKALALEFASGGFNVVLTGRNEQALAQVAADCSDKFRVATEVLPAELSRSDSTDRLIATIAMTADSSISAYSQNAVRRCVQPLRIKR